MTVSSSSSDSIALNSNYSSGIAQPKTTSSQEARSNGIPHSPTAQINKGISSRRSLTPTSPKINALATRFSHLNLMDEAALTPLSEHKAILLADLPEGSMSGNTRRLSSLFNKNLSPLSRKESLNSPEQSSYRRTSESKENYAFDKRNSLSSNEFLLSPNELRRSSSVSSRDSDSPDSSRRKSSIFGFDQKGILKLEAKEASKAKIPEGIENRIKAWLQKNEVKLKGEDRIPYDEKDIPIAIEAFKSECQCSWKEMKHQWGSDPTKLKSLQVINDMRKIEIEEITTIIKAKYPDIEIQNAGSTDLTSDCDLSLGIKSDKAKEIEAVGTYRQIFAERGWGASSAFIFDNNSYTQFYIEQLNNFDQQVEQQNMQNTMSLVMFARNAGSEKWEALKASLLKNVDSTTSKDLTNQFAIVESTVHELQLENDNEILKEGIKDEPIQNNSEMAAQIRSINPDLIIKVDGQLEIKFKKMVTDTIVSRENLLKNLEDMKKADNPEQSIKIYNDSLKIVSHFMDGEIARLKEQKVNVVKEAARIGQMDPKKAIPMREFSANLSKKINELENNLNRTSTLSNESFKQWGEITKEINNINQKLRMIDNFPLTLHMLNEHRNKLNNSLNSQNIEITKIKLCELEESIDTISLQMRDSKTTINELKTRAKKLSENLKDLNRQDVISLNYLLNVTDMMQNTIELNSMKAQCFAQEAHVSYGAIGFVVNDIQKEELHARSCGGYFQAINELLGFYHAHQAHSETPHGKLIEVSKYVGPRLMEAFARLKLQARSQNIPFPESKEEESIKSFFNELLILRKSKGLTDVDKKKLVQNFGIKYNMPFTQSGNIDSKAIDQMMLAAHTRIIAWFNKLTPEQKVR